MNTSIIIWVVAILIVLGIAFGIYFAMDQKSRNIFTDKYLLQRGMGKPVIWLYYDNSDVNSRWWADFGARSSRVLNIPFLNLCYESIVSHNKDNYRVEVISGLSGVAELLGGWDNLPPGLRDSIAPVNQAELNYIRSAVLAKYGGLWLDPFSICIKGFGKLPSDKIVFFGTDLDESYAGQNGTSVPGFKSIWSPKPAEPLFVEWTDICYKRVAEARGGQQIRGDAKWDFVALSSKYPGVEIRPSAEGARKKGGKRIQLDDLLSSGMGKNIPFSVGSEVVYIPIMWTELRDREQFQWFLRMSEEQIMESDLAVKHLFDKAMIISV
jgi:hypothetical protein